MHEINYLRRFFFYLFTWRPLHWWSYPNNSIKRLLRVRQCHPGFSCRYRLVRASSPTAYGVSASCRHLSHRCEDQVLHLALIKWNITKNCPCLSSPWFLHTFDKKVFRNFCKISVQFLTLSIVIRLLVNYTLLVTLTNDLHNLAIN